jgi:ABC-type lipoprotein release transport system permease subunit
VLAIALGVALGAAVYLVNSAALNEFGLATKRLVGEADIVVRGPREGFPDALFVELVRDPSVRMASPVLELEVALPGRRDNLKLLGLDPFRAAALQPALIAEIERRALELFRTDGVILSAQASSDLGVARGGELAVIVANRPRALRVLDVLPADVYPQPLGIMDIASAQRTLDALGRLNRIDLRLNPGVDVESFRAYLAHRLPPVRGLPLFGYAAIASLLLGAVLLVPALTVRILGIAPRMRRVVPDTALAQLKDNIALSTLSLASIIVSFSLMVAMAIMVYSFRVSFEHWLVKLLPADVQIREPYGNDTAYWSVEEQRAVQALPQIARAQFRRTRQIYLDPARPPVTLIARGTTAAQAADELPLLESVPPDSATPVVWISEALRDLYGYAPGQSIELPLGGQMRRFLIAGVWRDYVRTSGALVMTRGAYIDATGDRDANEGSLWLDPGTSEVAAEAAVRATLTQGEVRSSLEMLTSTALRTRSLAIFDRAFAITYALEAIAVLIGLIGVSFAASSTALARRAEFGMLRHLGMLRRQVIAMLASEGILMSSLGVIYGLALGVVLSLVLVFVVNRQSFNWSIDLAVPGWQLAALAALLIVAAAVTAVWSGRTAMNQDAVRAVREDW